MKHAPARLFMVGLLAGCIGAVGPGEVPPPDDTPGPRPAFSPARAPAAPAPTRPDQGAAFEEVTDRILLLPFSVRLNKLALLAGAKTDDPMFAELRRERFELGDHDFGAGVAPDLAWSSRRMSVWMRALVPVCKAPALRKKFPSLRANLSDFVLAAYGRAATAEDTTDYQEAVKGLPLDAEGEYTAACVALLSTTEFVAQ